MLCETTTFCQRGWLFQIVHLFLLFCYSIPLSMPCMPIAIPYRHSHSAHLTQLTIYLVPNRSIASNGFIAGQCEFHFIFFQNLSAQKQKHREIGQFILSNQIYTNLITATKFGWKNVIVVFYIYMFFVSLQVLCFFHVL